MNYQQNKKITDSEMRKMDKKANRLYGAGCLTFLGTAGLFTYFAINKTAYPDEAFGLCLLGVVSSYGLNQIAYGINQKTKEIQKKKHEKER